MGRIAEALKRAERERQQSLQGASLHDSSVGALDASPGPLTDLGAAPPEPIRSAIPAGDLTGTVVADPPDGESAVEARISGRKSAPMAECLVAYHQKTGLITEQYRSLRTRLLSHNTQGEHRIIGITSAIPKEGKSVTTVNLGHCFAEIRHLRILMVDGDFRRSTLARLLGIPAKPGLADILTGRCSYQDAIQATPIPNLHIITAGSTRDRSAAELLSTRAARDIFRRMQNDYHYTMVDTPPATTVTDAGIIGQMCSGVILIVRLNYTHENTARSAVRLLQANNVPLLGGLVIGRDRPLAGYGYYYGSSYYRYYHYYNRYYSSEAQSEK